MIFQANISRIITKKISTAKRAVRQIKKISIIIIFQFCKNKIN